MKRAACVALFFLAAVPTYASDISIRYGNGLSRSENQGLFDFTPSSDGKILQLAFTHRPWLKRNDWIGNLYLEAAAGIQSEVDFGKITSSVYEAAPGARISFGPMRVWLSHGLVHFGHFESKPKTQFSTRFGLAFVDSVSGLAIGLERTHYSTGDVDPLAFSGDDYVGFSLSLPLQRKTDSGS